MLIERKSKINHSDKILVGNRIVKGMSIPNKFITKYAECDKGFQFLRVWVTEFF